MQFDPDDEDRFFEFRDELVARFESTAPGTDLGWVAGTVLDFKFGYLDGDIGHWSGEDVLEILLGLYPRKVMVDPDNIKGIIAGFAAFLRFLGNESILPTKHAERLATGVEQLEDEFRKTVSDPSNWGMGKRLWAEAASEGVDPGDERRLQEFIERFNQLPFAQRDAILGPAGFPPVQPFPTVALPPDSTLEGIAANTVVMKRIHRLVDFVGGGRDLTQTGNLKLADGPPLIDLLETNDRFDEVIGDRKFKTQSTADLPGVHLTFLLAVESKLLRRRKTKVVPGKHARLLSDDPLEAFYGVFLAFIHQIGPTQYHYARHSYGWGWYAEDLDEELPMMLLEMYRNGPHAIEELADHFWDLEMSRYEFPGVPADKLEFHHKLVTSSVRQALHRLVDLGIVDVDGVTETPNSVGGVDPSGGATELTPLGTWAMQRIASGIAPAPVAGELADLSAADLLDAVQDLGDDLAQAETTAWIDRHPDAADHIVEALGDANETARGIGFRMLLDIGSDAEEAVDNLASHPELGVLAIVWRVDTLRAASEEMDCSDDPERFVRLLGSVVELWGPEAAAGGWAGPAAGSPGLAAMLDRIWRVRLPATSDVLSAIGGHHPDKKVAKAARTALFKHRNSSDASSS